MDHMRISGTEPSSVILSQNSQMQNNANKGEKRESQMRKNAKVKCEKTQSMRNNAKKAKKCESQMSKKKKHEKRRKHAKVKSERTLIKA